MSGARLTAAFPVSPKPVEDGQQLPFINDELLKLLPQLRTFANMLSWEKKTASTAGAGAYVSLWTSEVMPSDAAWVITAWTDGISSSGAAQQAGYVFAGTFVSVAGAVSQLGATSSLLSNESAAAIDAKFTVDAVGRTIAVQVRDDAASPMRFTGVIATLEGLAA